MSSNFLGTASLFPGWLSVVLSLAWDAVGALVFRMNEFIYIYYITYNF